MTTARRSGTIFATAISLLFVAAQSHAANLTWDASGANPTTPTDGSGLWDATTAANWTSGIAPDIVWDNASTAVFGANNGAAGTITIDDPSGLVTAAGITFNAAGSGNYTIAAGPSDSLSFVAGTNPVIQVASNVSPIISAPISGTFGTAATATGAGLSLKGTGTLTLSGVSTYSGATTIEYGGVNNTGMTVNLAPGSSLGSSTSNVYVGFITTASATDTSVLNMNGNSTLTAGTVFIDYVQNHTSVSSTSGSTLSVNGNNTIDADNIIIDAGSANGSTKGGAGLLKLGSGATLTLNGGAGAGNNVTLLDIANYSYESGGGTGAGIIGTADFSAGTVNGTITTINVGTAKAGSGTGAASTGNMLFANGALNATTINIARRASSGQGAVGTLTLAAGGTGTLTAGSIAFGGTGNAAASTLGTIQLNGATLVMNGDIISNTTVATNSTINLAGGTLDMGGGGTAHNIGTLANPVTLNATSGTLMNLASLNGTGPLTKSGGGTVTLAGTNSYPGDTIISGGTLSVTGTMLQPSGGGGNINVNTNGTLSGNGDGVASGLAGAVMVSGGTVRPGTIAGDIAKLTTADFTIHTGGVAVDLGPSFTSDLINILGGLTLGDNASSSLALTLSGTPSLGNYEIIDYSGALTKNADFTITGPLGFNYGLNYATTGKVFLNVAASSNLLTWNGAADQTNWDTTHANFSNGTSNVAYADPKSVKFDDTAPAGATNVSISGTVSPTAVSVNSSTRNFTFQGSGAIGGAATLTKDGSSTLTIVNNNTYSGSTTINSGTVQVGNGGTTGSLGTGPISVDGTLAYKRSDTVVLANSISGAGTLQQLGNGTLALTGNNAYGATVVSAGTLQIGNGGTTGSVGNGPVTNNGTLAFNHSDDITFSNAVSGTGGIALIAPSAVTLSGANNYSGPVTVASGSTLKLANANSLGSTASGTGSVTVATGGTLDIGTNIDNVNFGGSRVFHIQGTGVGGLGAIRNTTASIQSNALNFLTLDGDALISGNRIDIGNSALNGVLNLQGHTLTTSFGPVGVNHEFLINLSVTAGQIVVSSGGLALTNGASVLADGSGSAITYNAGTVAVFVANDPGTITRPMTFLGNNTIGANSAVTATVNSNMTLQGNVTLAPTNNGSQNLASNNPLVLAGNISESGGSFGLTKIGSNTTTLSGSNTYTGPTTVNTGILVLGNSNRIHDASNLVLGGGTFNTGGFNETMNQLNLKVTSTIDFGAGASVVHFSNSSVPAWTGTLNLANWDGNATDVTLGGGTDQIFVGNNGFSGLSRIQLNSIQFANQPLGALLLPTGELVPNTTGIPLATMVQGDFDQNNAIDPGDITAMLKALADLKAYAISKQISDGDVVALGDFDNSGAVTNADIQAELDLVAANGFGSVAPVPEPATAMLLIVGALASPLFIGRRVSQQRSAMTD